MAVLSMATFHVTSLPESGGTILMLRISQMLFRWCPCVEHLNIENPVGMSRLKNGDFLASQMNSTG